LAGPVGPEDAQDLAASYLQREIAQRPDRLVPGGAAQRRPLEGTVQGTGVDAELLAQSRGPKQDVRAHRASLISDLIFRMVQAPAAMAATAQPIMAAQAAGPGALPSTSSSRMDRMKTYGGLKASADTARRGSIDSG